MAYELGGAVGGGAGGLFGSWGLHTPQSPFAPFATQQFPLFPDLRAAQAPVVAPPRLPAEAKAEQITGFGQLTWLSSKAGLITCKNKMVISFQIKDFCDQQLTDLTAVLRPGFTLSFQAQLSETSEYIATLVSPLHGAESEKVFAGAGEVDLEAVAGGTSSQLPPSKESYSLQLELKAIPMLLAIFQRHSLPQIQLSSLHSQISNCGDEELFRYVGSSSLKRRQFVERRSHLFRLAPDDLIGLQPAWLYDTVRLLASHLLRRGGVTAIQSLYEFYVNSPEVPLETREQIGDGRSEFLQLVNSHPWVFALFPSRVYVAVRRNLPHFDYSSFVSLNFADSDLFRPRTMPFVRPSLTRSMSSQPMSHPRKLSVTPLTPSYVWDPSPTPPPQSDPWPSLFSSSSSWRTTPPASTGKVSVATQTERNTVDTGVGPSENLCATCRCGCSRGSPAGSGPVTPPSTSSTESSQPSPAAALPAPISYYDPFSSKFSLGDLSAEFKTALDL